MERIPASERTREKLKAVIAGSSDGGTSELVRLAARVIIEEALKGEAHDALGQLRQTSSITPRCVAASPSPTWRRACRRALRCGQPA